MRFEVSEIKINVSIVDCDQYTRSILLQYYSRIIAYDILNFNLEKAPSTTHRISYIVLLNGPNFA